MHPGLQVGEDAPRAAAAGGAAVAGGFPASAGFRRRAAHGAEWPVHCGEDFRQGNARGREVQLIAAADAAPAFEQAGLFQREENLLEELERDVLRGGQFLDLGNGVEWLAGHGSEGTQGVFGFAGDAHGSV